MLARYRSDGTRVGTYLHADTLVFKIELVADGPWLAEASDGGVFAGLAAVPTVTRLSPGWQTLSATSVAPPGWVQLAPRTQPARSLRDMRDWLLASSLAGPALTLADGRLYLAFQRTAGDSTGYSLAVYSPAGQLQEVLTDVPGRPLTGHAQSLFTADEDRDGFTLIQRFDALPRSAAQE